MNYEQFICAMLEGTEKRLTEMESVERQEILRNNGVCLTGLVVRQKKNCVAPIIYLEEFYEKYLLGADIELLCEFLLQKSRTAHLPSVDGMKEMLDFEKIRTQIVYKLVNVEKNQRMLTEVPNLPVFDLAIVFYWIVSLGESETSSVLIRNEHMNLWGIPISVLYECAKENTQRLYPPVFRSLDDYMEELMGEKFETGLMYILSNEAGVNGASVLLYPGIPGKIHKILKRNYYLLPSSIHEFLVVPEDPFISPENLKSIVREVNAAHLKEEELLSDQIYYFDGDIITKM